VKTLIVKISYIMYLHLKVDNFLKNINSKKTN
jgi:hypothetical protein